MTTDVQFNNQVGQIVRAALYLQQAGFFCAVTYHTKGVDLANGTENSAAFVAVSVYYCLRDFQADDTQPILAAIVSQDDKESAQAIARQMENLIPA
jgi:hypothetical protein